jgi:hypothetical protein
MTTYFWENYLLEVPLYSHLIQSFDDIKLEVLNYIQQPNILFDYPLCLVEDFENNPIQLYKNLWKVVPVSTFDEDFILNLGDREHSIISNIITNSKWNCPILSSLISGLESQGDLNNCFISKLSPGSVINSHKGLTSDCMRIHLGLVCDPECKITIGNESRSWENGKLLAFKYDYQNIFGVNHEGTSDRIILSLDLRISYLQKFVPQLK